MLKRLPVITFLSWLFALAIWQTIFNSHPILSEILWEIHTIFSSVILFYILLNLLVNEQILDLIKFTFRIVFKVWIIIFIAFSMHRSFDQKAFILTATFVFGYLEGLIDINSWLKSTSLTIPMLKSTKHNKMMVSIIFISMIHVFCAFIALVFFNIE
ncbi:MAG: hypothetical protein V4497_04925 [Bacteroidota bacterium]